MANVYRAFDRKHGRIVAVKVMRPDLTGADGAARFLREIQLTARLSHPHILPLLDSGSVEGTPFFVMPFVEGESLGERLRHAGRLSLDDALRIAGEVADALAYAHAQGIVHCDIKPDNILLSGRHALVADFGVARAMRAADDRAATPRSVIGTPPYMSPEQARGEDTLDGRSDVYSLGVVTFEMLAGERPYSGRHASEVIARSVAGFLPSVRTWNPALPEALDTILKTAMSRMPQERFATAADFGDALAAVERGAGADQPLRHASLTTPSIAVLPFRNLSPEPDTGYLSEGITEEVTAALGRVQAFRVCAYSSARAVDTRALAAREIGERLGVAWLLTGSVRRAGGHLRVTAELVNAVDGLQLWSDKFDRTASDSMAVQDDIASAIAASLASRPSPPKDGTPPLSDVDTTIETEASLTPLEIQPSSARTQSPQAYELYLRGRFLWNRRTPDRLAEAIRCFASAAELDPGFALAHAGLAAAGATAALYGASSPSAVMSDARRSAARALVLDASCADARTALALVLAGYDWNWDAAQDQLHEAARLAPHDATPHQWLASMCLLPNGRIDEALDAVRRALRRDPLSLTVKTTLASVLYAARRYREAIVTARDVTSLDPSFAPAYFFLGQALTLVDEHGEAVQVCRQAVELSSRSAESLAVLCLALSRAGNVTDAIAVREELHTRAATRYISKGQRALASLALGERDAALEQLESAVEERATDLIWLAARPVWDPIRDDERFQRVLARMELKRRN